ncbi:hypothetical protein VNO77_10924 [Canavalia gladiata]|uniref:Ribonuclease H2 subunit B n=1 Tax=Canavalia gladiata TaxID=3824 RepID=A0AAN9MBL8_CANGL
MSPHKLLSHNFLCIIPIISQLSSFSLFPTPSTITPISFHLPIMAHETEYCSLLMLFMLATCVLPSLGDNAQALINFKSFLSNADALNNWGNLSIGLCSWTGILCFDQKFHGLRLENMGLSGVINVDTLLELSNLNSFSVINNNFEGPMPAFKKIVSLRALFLTNNKFSGEIPDDGFEGMKRLKRVFLADNGFTDRIPTSLANLANLVDVDLHGNSFDGNIPEFQQSDFRVFNLSYNRLEGPIPESLSNQDPSSFAGNEGVCGKPLSPCSSSSTPPPSDQRPNSTLPDQPKAPRKNRLLLTVIVVLVVVVLASILALLFIRYRRRKTTQPAFVEDTQPQNINSESSGSKSIVASVESKKSSDGGLNFVRKEREEFDLQDLLRASAEVLGSGSFGATYKAMVLSGPVVVVKRFKHMNNVGKREFFEHMKRLGSLSHPNLLPLVAFYCGKEEKLLVHDFAENGSLASHLHGRRGSELDWRSRLKIIKGVARGLAYLYSEFPCQSLPHGHLKSSNVVLDNSFEPRLAEYGLVGVVDKSHAQQFMVAYKSPEVSQFEKPSEKSDVWCLGILILEVLTGRFPANYLRHGKGASEDLAAWVNSIVSEGWSDEVVDKEIPGRRGGEGEMVKLLRIGMGCCEWDLNSRWGWKEAVAKIEELKERDVEDASQGDHLHSSQDDFTLSFTKWPVFQKGRSRKAILMVSACESLTFPRAPHFVIHRHSHSSLVTFLVNSTPFRVKLTSSARASRSFSAKPMSWCEGVQEPRVLVAPDACTNGNGLGQMILLRHPKSGNGTQYLFVNGVLQELNWFKNLHGSWFLGDYISEDGRLYLSTPVDPVFLMLPIFEEARMKKGDDLGKFRQLDEILFVDGYPGYQQLLSIVENCMQVVCEVKEVGSLKFFRLDDSKVLCWLCYKVCQLKETLPKLDKNYAVQSEKDTLIDAVSILGEYLKEEPWLQPLCNHLKLNILEVTGKAQVNAEGSNSGLCNELQEESDDRKATIAKKGRQAKKVKLETESHNIKEMFSRASRKKS